MKLLIVDDDDSRANELSSYIVQYCNISLSCITVKHNTNSAKRLLKSTFFDFLILDVVLPQRDETPSSESGIKLLTQLNESKHLKKPSKIIGITADLESIEIYKEEFTKYLNLVIDASLSNLSWKKSISDAINYHKQSLGSKVTTDTDIVVISAHGIRTFGQWQNTFEKLVFDEVGTVDFQSFKFGYFDLVAFTIPKLRDKLVDRLYSELVDIVERKPDSKFYFFSHSFGTYLIVRAITLALKSEKKLNIELIVLSGSVLSQEGGLSHIMTDTTATIINECGINDNILLLSEAIIPGTGMAGRVGFVGFENSRIINRYFNGGHSLYFDDESEFMRKYWIPLFYSSPARVDQRSKPKFINRKIELLARYINNRKLPLVLILLMVFTIAFLI